MTETGVKKLIIQILKNDASIALAEAADDVETGEAAAQRQSGDRIERGVGGGGGGGGGRVDRVVEEAEEVTRRRRGLGTGSEVKEVVVAEIALAKTNDGRFGRMTTVGRKRREVFETAASLFIAVSRLI